MKWLVTQVFKKTTHKHVQWFYCLFFSSSWKMAYSFEETKGCRLFNGRPTTEPTNQATDTRSEERLLFSLVCGCFWVCLWLLVVSCGLIGRSWRPGAVHYRPTGPRVQTAGELPVLSGRAWPPPRDVWHGNRRTVWHIPWQMWFNSSSSSRDL